MPILIDTRDQNFILSGSIDIIKNNPRIKRRFEAETSNAIFNDNDIIISFSQNQSDQSAPYYENQYEAIIKIFDRHDIEYTISNITKSLVDNLVKEHKNFEEFSKKAYAIRNGEVKKEDFSLFLKLLKEKLPGRQLYSLQQRSAYHLAFSQNACNFSVPGSGKTTSVYAAYAYLKSLEKSNPKYVDRLLVISPLSAFKPWVKEYKDCFGKEPSLKRLRGISAAERKNFFLSNKYTELALISYQGVSSSEEDIESIISYLKKYKVMVVLDEAHRIKRTDGKWAEAILAISRYCSSRVVLTGTPIPYGYQDLNNLYKFIWPTKDIIPFPVPHLKRMSESNYSSLKSDIDTLTDNISAFFIRIKKSDLELAEIINHPPIKVNMTSSQKAIHDYLYEDYMHDMEKSYKTRRLISGRQVRLRQAATNPALLKEALDKYSQEDNRMDDTPIANDDILEHIELCSSPNFIPPKFQVTLDLIKDIQQNNGADGKVTIWCSFISNIYRLQKYLSDNNIISEILYGGIESETDESEVSEIELETNIINDEKINITREDILKRFHDDSALKVIIANPMVVGESISIHTACHNAIYFEKDYNAATYVQSKDRIHRVDDNTNYSVNYYHLISDNSIEELIHQVICDRESRQLEVLEKNEIPFFKKTDEELITYDMLKIYYDGNITPNN